MSAHDDYPVDFRRVEDRDLLLSLGEVVELAVRAKVCALKEEIGKNGYHVDFFEINFGTIQVTYIAWPATAYILKIVLTEGFPKTAFGQLLAG